MQITRIGAVISLNSGAVGEYERLHQAVWPGVLRQIQDSNFRNYTIFRYGTLLFSTMEYAGDDLERDEDAMRNDLETRAWWDRTAPLQRPVPEARAGEWWHRIPEIFHVD